MPSGEAFALYSSLCTKVRRTGSVAGKLFPCAYGPATASIAWAARKFFSAVTFKRVKRSATALLHMREWQAYIFNQKRGDYRATRSGSEAHALLVDSPKRRSSKGAWAWRNELSESPLSPDKLAKAGLSLEVSAFEVDPVKTQRRS